jgi:hypothetical protein
VETPTAPSNSGSMAVNYTIDLSEKNAGKLRKALDPI